MTLTAHSTTVVESLSDNHSECDGEQEVDFSDNDLEILSEQSGTVDATNSTNTESGGTEVPDKKGTNKSFIITDKVKGRRGGGKVSVL